MLKLLLIWPWLGNKWKRLLLSWEAGVYETAYSCCSKTMLMGKLPVALIINQIFIKSTHSKIIYLPEKMFQDLQVSEVLLSCLTYRFIWKNSVKSHMNKDLQKSPTAITSVRHYELSFHYYFYHKPLNMTVYECDFLSQWHRINWPS